MQHTHALALAGRRILGQTDSVGGAASNNDKSVQAKLSHTADGGGGGGCHCHPQCWGHCQHPLGCPELQANSVHSWNSGPLGPSPRLGALVVTLAPPLRLSVASVIYHHCCHLFNCSARVHDRHSDSDRPGPFGPVSLPSRSNLLFEWNVMRRSDSLIRDHTFSSFLVVVTLIPASSRDTWGLMKVKIVRPC